MGFAILKAIIFSEPLRKFLNLRCKLSVNFWRDEIHKNRLPLSTYIIVERGNFIMQIYISDGIWQQVIGHTVITAVFSDNGALLAYKTERYSSKKAAKHAAQNKA